ncbi:MAG: trehalose-6-phosphate synthase [Desulfovermiculus sp.]
MTPNPQHRRLVVVSNRLPVKFTNNGQAELSSGGLVTAMVPVLNKRGGLWLGWPGTWGDLGPELDKFSHDKPYSLQPVTLTREDMDRFYTGFANQVLWPLFHGFQTKCVFDSCFWEAYERVNETFAREVTANSSASDYIWIHDYHLINVAQKIKQSGANRECGFYLHIPFPSPDVFFTLPWRNEILSGLLKYDVIGFQTAWDLKNFLRTVNTIFPEYSVSATHSLSHLTFGGEKISAGVFPISIDFDEFSRHSARVTPQQSHFLKGSAKHQTVLGVDRLDYTKGIPQRLRAFAQVLQDYPELRQKITLVQVVVPSRESVDEYQLLKKKIERLVGEINGEYATFEWTPIQYIYRSLSRHELVSWYQQADIALITPIRDGMNLVAKEYCACQNSRPGVLVLSELAGAASQLKPEALTVNPFAINNMAQAIQKAYTMPLQERKDRMLAMRRKIKSQDVYWWLDSFLAAALRKGEVKLRRRERPTLSLRAANNFAHKTISV